MRIVPYPFSCSACRMDFEGELVEHAPFDVAIAAMRSVRCPRCRGGPDVVCMGSMPRSVRDDRLVREAHPDAPLRERWEDWRTNGLPADPAETVARTLFGWSAYETFDDRPPASLRDLRSLALMIDRIPEIEARLPEMTVVSARWAAFVAAYRDVMTTWRREAGRDLDPSASAAKTRAELARLLAGGDPACDEPHVRRQSALQDPRSTATETKDAYGMADMDDIRERLSGLFSEHLGIDREKVTDDADIVDDLDADSLDVVELVMAVEEEFGVEIPDDVAEGMRTPGDIARFVAKAAA